MIRLPFATAALAAALFSAGALAQTTDRAPGVTLIVLPTETIVLPVEQVGSMVPGPQDPAAARKEAVAARAQADRPISDAGPRAKPAATRRAPHRA